MRTLELIQRSHHKWFWHISKDILKNELVQPSSKNLQIESCCRNMPDPPGSTHTPLHPGSLFSPDFRSTAGTGCGRRKPRRLWYESVNHEGLGKKCSTCGRYAIKMELSAKIMIQSGRKYRETKSPQMDKIEGFHMLIRHTSVNGKISVLL